MTSNLAQFTLTDVVAALRLANEGTDNYEKFGRVVEVILANAEETPSDNRGGVEILVALQRAGDLTFELTT